ncbi:CaiB/BaiF CoA transferase family protein [Nocardioides antri]|uniref:CoA transferase n=1 Tax=Nocardioides antri TaxID=2607659 RepID=A0A5B1M737_9ACTN|nr:CaiB/BaiF CoA-transferase family protein [Nocardioides antri]KAA1427677.1 CoA transferase [Nocardioides antri]
MTVGGPLADLRVVELTGLAPAPFGCMVLADLGAEVVRVDRAGPGGDGLLAPSGVLDRSRRSIAIDLKTDEGREVLLRLVDEADVLVEGYRPGVAERLGIGPEACLERNPRLVYARMTGWGQDGPLAPRAGHDINYIALSGALEPIGTADGKPVPPLNLLGDFGGGGLLMAMGVLAALHERSSSGRGQVVDAAMVDGSALLTAFIHGMHHAGLWQQERGHNIFDGTAAFYDTYACADGRFVAVGCVEPHFYAELVERLGLADTDLPHQFDFDAADKLKAHFAEVFATRPRDEWAAVFADSDACVTPVLSPFEAHEHPHNAARSTFTVVGGIRQPAPAPRFSRTPASDPRPPRRPGTDTDEILGELGLDAAAVTRLRASGAVE